MRIQRRGYRLFFLVIILWLLFLAIDVLKKNNLDYSSPYFRYYYLMGFAIWIALTFPVMTLFKRSANLKLWKRALLFLVLGIVVGGFKVYFNRLLYFAIMKAIDEAFQSASWLAALSSFGRTFFYMEAIIIAWVMIIVLYLVEISNKYKNKSLEAAQLESELANAKLQALRMQIHPHCLFNAHNAIVTLMRSGQNDLALEMLLKLSDLLRVSMNNFKDQFVTLKEEVSFINNYLEIEKVRFEDTLKVEQQMDQEVMNAKVPVFILQPLVENAIKHGVSKNLGNSIISLKAFKKNEVLILKVYNTGEFIPSNEMSTNNGIGLKNLRNRLNTLFDSRASLRFFQNLEGVEANLSIPFEEL